MKEREYRIDEHDWIDTVMGIAGWAGWIGICVMFVVAVGGRL